MRFPPVLRAALALPLLALPAACATAPDRPAQTAASAAPAEARAPITILVSIDGLAARRLGKGLTPRLDALAREGASGSMRPSFPTNTFPNHITLVTGLRPGHHGIVNNIMRDPARPGVTFKTSDPDTNRDPFWWDGADPIWVQAEKAGMRTGALFWPGSDVAIRGTRASSWWRYDAAITSAQRVAAVLDWARRPAASRPGLILLYFDVVDKAAHNQGYDSPEERAAIGDVDRSVGDLVDGLAAMAQPANLVIVSDHGMARVPQDHVRPLSEAIDPAIMESITEGPLLDVFPKPGKEADVAARLAKPIPHLTCWARNAIPARFHFEGSPRIAPYICMAETGWTFVNQPRSFVKGEHGFDPDEPDIAALFIARGPSVRPHPPLGRFDNVDIYAFVARLAGLRPAPNDGNAATLDPLLVKP